VSDQTIDRTTLPIRRPPFQGVLSQTLDGSQPDWEQIGHVKAPHGSAERLGRADRRRRLRQPEHVRRANRHAELRPDGRTGAALQPLPRNGDVLANEGRAAHGTQPPRGWHGRHPGVLRRLPGLFGHAAEGRGTVPEDPEGERLFDRGGRQVAPDARERARPGRSVRPLAQRLGLRLLLGLPGSRGRSVRHDDRREPEVHRSSGREGREALLLPGGDDRPGDRLAPRCSWPRFREAVVPLLLDRLQPRAPSRLEGVVREVQGPVRPGLGQASRGDVRPPEKSRRGAG